MILVYLNKRQKCLEKILTTPSTETITCIISIPENNTKYRQLFSPFSDEKIDSQRFRILPKVTHILRSGVTLLFIQEIKLLLQKKLTAQIDMICIISNLFIQPTLRFESQFVGGLVLMLSIANPVNHGLTASKTF